MKALAVTKPSVTNIFWVRPISFILKFVRIHPDNRYASTL